MSYSFCSQICDDIGKNKGQKFSNIFDINYKKIFGISIANMVISCTLFVIYIFLGCRLDKENSRETNEKILGIYCGIIILLYIARFILSILLFYFMEKSDLEKYDDFLDCKNIRKNFFKNLSDVNRIRNCSFAFLILNIIAQGIDKMENCLDYVDICEESSQKNNQNISNVSF